MRTYKIATNDSPCETGARITLIDEKKRNMNDEHYTYSDLAKRCERENKYEPYDNL